MNELLTNRIEKRFRTGKGEELLKILKDNYSEIYHNKINIETKIITIYFNTEEGLDNESTIRCKVYCNDVLNDTNIENAPCDLQTKVGDSNDGITVIKERYSTYGEVISKLSTISNSKYNTNSGIMKCIKNMTNNKNVFPYMKIYYSRQYFVGKVEKKEARITLDKDIVFENCKNEKKVSFNEYVMEVKMEIDDEYNENRVNYNIKQAFKGINLQNSTSKKLIGYNMIMW